MKHLNDKLADAIAQIHFFPMTIEEFFEIHSKYNGFFMSDKLNAVFYMIDQVKDFKSQ